MAADPVPTKNGPVPLQIGILFRIIFFPIVIKTKKPLNKS